MEDKTIEERLNPIKDFQALNMTQTSIVRTFLNK